MLSKVLIANRGEIARRIIRTLKARGIASVAVFSEADRESLHVAEADESVFLGPAPAGQSYLDVEAILRACEATGAQGVHPGYGFLSENAAFARRLAAKGVIFIGPTPENIEAFGLKHRARQAAVAAGVPLLPGTGLLPSAAEASLAAQALGWPVILKSTGGGGGIGMKVCRSDDELVRSFEAVQALAGRNFKDSGVYLERYVERARHVEVQIFGDGRGGVAVLGDRDCSVQRRNQKVVEEAPAPDLSPALRQELHDAAQRLASSQNYASAGTVEFVLDTDRNQFSFLEVNTRLQVEHTVTEEIYGIDLVDWMVLQAEGRWTTALAQGLEPKGHAVQVRLYAEDAGKGFLPCEGLVTETRWPDHVRVETWVRPGCRMTTHYDPLVAKLIVKADDRPSAIASMIAALGQTRVSGFQTNRAYLAAVLADPVFAQTRMTTGWLAGFTCTEAVVEVVRPGTLTTVQDWPGRTGAWMVGIPPSGPMDSFSFRVVNRIVGNPQGTAGLEITLAGPELVFRAPAVVAWGGAGCPVTLDGRAIPAWTAIGVATGQVLSLGKIEGPGQRAYLAIAGGWDVPEYLGSRATFTLGGFGGHGGRALRAGDILPFLPPPKPLVPASLAPGVPPPGPDWNPGCLRVTLGPQGAPEYFKEADVTRFLDAEWEVHFNSSRTGVRLIGPVPDWPRTDGGEAGLHPSNLHDNPYAVGALDFTGDMPVLLGPDGPSLGGFVCPFTVIHADLWKMGQLRSGDRIRFQAVGLTQARQAARILDRFVETLARLESDAEPPSSPGQETGESPVLDRWNDIEGRTVVLRRSGDRAVLLEVGEPVLDLELRLVVQWWYARLEAAALPGVIDLTPGIRSLQVHFDDELTRWEDLLAWLRTTGEAMPSLAEVEVPSRTVWLPLSWDDPSTRLAIEKYTSGVRADAPWCPWNIEFIRRINGLDRWEDVRDIVFGASYLVLGLGDVYLGAPVATPLDPRQRLVTTKYNPARTWTPENAVGIGGAYLCVYGMEGPGGYQFVGRTVPMWNRWFVTADFPQPWLLRFFDQIRFYPVTTDELASLRQDLPLGRTGLKIEQGTFRWRDYLSFLHGIEAETQAFGIRQKAAFDAERAHWKATGLDSFQSEAPAPASDATEVPPGCIGVEVPFSGSLWQHSVAVGDRVEAGQELVIVESMKMEITVEAPQGGTVVAFYQNPGDSVGPGRALAAIRIEA